jgi:hypothetical protein
MSEFSNIIIQNPPSEVVQIPVIQTEILSPIVNLNVNVSKSMTATSSKVKWPLAKLRGNPELHQDLNMTISNKSMIFGLKYPKLQTKNVKNDIKTFDRRTLFE